MSTDVEMAIQDSGESDPGPPPVIYPNLVESIALFLANKVMAHDIKFQTTKNPKTQFTSLFPPRIRIDEYLYHLMKYYKTCPGVVVCMLIYIEKIISVMEKNYQKSSRTEVPFLMTSYNAHRLLLTAFLLAHKYGTDYKISTSEIAKIGGIEPKELLKLEIEFLSFVRYKLYISEEEFSKYHNSVLTYGREIVMQSRV